MSEASITDIVVTFTSAAESATHSPVGKVSHDVWLWTVKDADRPSVCGLRVLIGDEVPPQGFVVRTGNLQQNLPGANQVYLAVNFGDNLSANAYVDLKMPPSYEEGGYVTLANALNPDQPAPAPKTKLSFLTRAASQKIKTNDYEVGDRLDNLDGSSWRTVTVIATRNITGVKEIQMHFDGWTSTYDEWKFITVGSQKLLPLGKKTEGKWTGSGKPTVNLSDTAMMEKFLSSCNGFNAIQESKEFGADALTFLKSDIGMKFVGEFFEANILPELMEQAASFVYLVSRCMAKALQDIKGELPLEISDGITTIFTGTSDKGAAASPGFYSKYGRELDTQLGAEAKFADRKDGASIYLINAINHFGHAGGFSAMIQRLQAFVAPNQTERRSFISVCSLIKMFSNMKDFLTSDFLNALAQSVDFQQLIEIGFANVTDEELKKIGNDDALTKVTKGVETLLLASKSESEVCQFTEVTNCNLALRLLNSQVLEKKMNGMAKLQKIITSVDPNTADIPSPKTAEPVSIIGPLPYPQRGARAKVEEIVPPAKFLTPVSLRNWIFDREVLNIILSSQQHPEIVRRSPSVLKFLARQGALTTEHINLLWTIVAAGTHEDLSRIVYDTFADIAQDMSKPHLDFLFSRIEAKPFHDYQDFDINYVKTFTENAVKASAKSAPGNWYGLDLLFRMSTDAKLSSEIRSLARGSLKELLSQSLFASQTAVYECKAIRGLNLQGSFNPSFFSCLNLLTLIFNIDDAHVQQVEKEQDSLVDLVLAGAELYIRTAREIKTQKLITEAKNVCYVANLPHTVCIESVLNFLFFYLSQTTVTITEGQVNTMWRVFVTGAIDAPDRDCALDWFATISYNQPRGKELHVCLSASCYPIFLGLLSQPQTDIPITFRWFQCFMKFFLQCNVGKGILDADVEYLQVTDFQQLGTSIRAIWPFLLSSNNDVSIAASKFFVSLHIRLDPSIRSVDKKAIFEEFLDTCAKNLTEFSSAEQQSRVLDLLLQFLDRLQKGESVERPLFRIGEKVMARYKPQTENAKTYRGAIRGINPRGEGKDQTYDILYDDGDQWLECPERHIFEITNAVRARQITHASENVNSHPRTFLAQSSTFFNLFFGLLGAGGDVGEKAWSLIQILPKSVSLTSKLENLVSADSVDWKELLPASSLIKLLYVLEIVEQIVRTQSSQEWSEMFMRTNGLDYLLNVYNSVDTKKILSSQHSATCVGIIISLVTRFGSASDTQRFDTAAFLNKLLQTLLGILESSLASWTFLLRKCWKVSCLCWESKLNCFLHFPHQKNFGRALLCEAFFTAAAATFAKC